MFSITPFFTDVQCHFQFSIYSFRARKITSATNERFLSFWVMLFLLLLVVVAFCFSDLFLFQILKSETDHHSVRGQSLEKHHSVFVSDRRDSEWNTNHSIGPNAPANISWLIWAENSCFQAQFSFVCQCPTSAS